MSTLTTTVILVIFSILGFIYFWKTKNSLYAFAYVIYAIIVIFVYLMIKVQM